VAKKKAAKKPKKRARSKAKPVRSKRMRRKNVKLRRAKTTISGQLHALLTQMLAAGWTQDTLAEVCDVPQSTLSGWLNGSRQNMRLDTVDKIAQFTGATMTIPKALPRVENHFECTAISVNR